MDKTNFKKGACPQDSQGTCLPNLHGCTKRFQPIDVKFLEQIQAEKLWRGLVLHRSIQEIAKTTNSIANDDFGEQAGADRRGNERNHLVAHPSAVQPEFGCSRPKLEPADDFQQ